MPPQELAKKVTKKIITKVKDKLQKSKDLKKGTHINFDVALIKNSYVDIKELDTSNIDIKVARYLSRMYCEHRFDLLGSGWVKNSYDSVALGVEGYKYEMNVQAPQSIADEYEPIDWQKDYKSGYRWSEKTWYKNQPLGHKLGVDIKVPWELARFQHLPQLAIFAIADASLKEQNINEFKHQVLDFIVNNPPRMGVTWVCTMDVGIRVANMLVAYDIFYQIDDTGILDRDFRQDFSNSVYEHGVHIVNNLEFHGDKSSNHYLSDIAGLLFVASYLESTDEVNTWLAFAIQELVWCMKTQFYEDGGNFESSTSYHRLSGELIAYSTALVLGLKQEKIKALQHYSHEEWKVNPCLLSLDQQAFSIDVLNFTICLPQWYSDRLFKAGRFTVDITKPSGEIPQIGDNDSGRFLKLSPNGMFIMNEEAEEKYFNLKGYNKLIEKYVQKNGLYWDENLLDHSTFISALAGLYAEDTFENSVLLEKSLIASMAKRKFILKDKAYAKTVISDTPSETLQYSNETIYKSHFKFENLKQISYPDSGIYIFKAANLYLSICATPLGQNGNGGHTHNDKLSYELWLDGEDITKDPGTYLYTALPERRNEFRSIKAHNVPIINDLEQNNWLEGKYGLFTINNEVVLNNLQIEKNFIELLLKYKNNIITRSFTISSEKISIVDHSNVRFKYNNIKSYSNGYGKMNNE